MSFCIIILVWTMLWSSWTTWWLLKWIPGHEAFLHTRSFRTASCHTLTLGWSKLTKSVQDCCLGNTNNKNLSRQEIILQGPASRKSRELFGSEKLFMFAMFAFKIKVSILLKVIRRKIDWLLSEEMCFLSTGFLFKNCLWARQVSRSFKKQTPGQKSRPSISNVSAE